MDQLRRPVTLVTGGGRGIGAAVVQRLAADGHDLVVAYRADGEAARTVASEARQQGGRVELVRADVTDPVQVDALFDEADTLFGRVTGLVNNAGATYHLGDLAETPVDVVRSVVDLNLTAALLCARRAVRSLSTRYGGAGGVIVNVSSAAATLGSPHEYVHYAAAKAGVDAMTVGLAKEVAADGVRVLGVAPGTVFTSIHADAGDADRAERLADQIPLGRSAQPAEVAGVVSFLLGPDAAYLTGTTIRMAGGR
jgi:NAD(P)-dependent dehydrogenase (short-subunit alcohol dehydrogenase family)